MVHLNIRDHATLVGPFVAFTVPASRTTLTFVDEDEDGIYSFFEEMAKSSSSGTASRNTASFIPQSTTIQAMTTISRFPEEPINRMADEPKHLQEF